MKVKKVIRLVAVGAVSVCVAWLVSRIVLLGVFFPADGHAVAV